MIELYTWGTPNGRKISIMLEELGLAYSVHPVNIGKNEQFEPAFLAIAPNNKIPAIVDTEASLSIFESGAILTYLADKTGRFLAPAGAARYKSLEWLNWQMGGLGPMLGQLGFFAFRSTEKSPLAIQRFTEEALRLLAVMEKRLGETNYLAGDDYTIADIACYPWCVGASTFMAPVLGERLSASPNFQRWLKAVGERPAVQRGMLIPKT
jgi:GST-like protein